MMSYKCLLILLFFFVGQSAKSHVKKYSQNKPLVDSLEKITNIEQKAQAYLKITQDITDWDIEQSRIWVEKTLKIARKNDLRHIEAEIYILLGSSISRNSLRGIDYLDTAENIAQNIKNNELLASIWAYKADCYVQFMEYEKAAFYAEKSVEWAEKYQLFYSQKPYLVLSTIAIKQGNLKQAIKPYREVIRIAQKHQPEDLPSWLSDMGNVFYAFAQYDSARYCYEQGLKIAQKYQQKKAMGFLSDNIGLSFYRQGKYNEAIFWQKKGLQYRREAHADLDIIVNLNNLTQTYLALGAYQLAYQNATESIFRLTKIDNQRLLLEITAFSAKIHQQKQNYDSAFFYQKMAFQTLDSIHSGQEKQISQIISMHIESNKRASENYLLKNQNDLLTIVLFSLSIILVITLVLGYFIFQQNQIRRKLLLQVQEANRTKDEMFALIAHDLRSPIAAFQIVFKQLDYYLKKNKLEKVQEIVSAVEKTGKNLSDLLENLLHWALSQKQEIRLEIKNIDFTTIFSHLNNNYQEVAHWADVQLEFRIMENIQIQSDENMLQTILRNLISNALKYTPQGGQISVILTKEAQKNVIMVQDTGKGMSKQQIQKLSNKQIKTSERGIRGEKGTGLGLSLVYEFAQMLALEISVESQPEKGTIFRIYLT